MRIKHFFTRKIAHSSYLLAGNKICAVIDPQRDIEIYMNEARALGVQITHIFQTHLHADFISGHLDLAKITGANIYAPALANCAFDHIGLSEGDEINIENIILQVIETPGHTPEHVSYIVRDTSRGESPIGVFVGDTLFVGDVGRPDLFPKLSDQLAGQLFDSLHNKIMKLPDYCEVYPAHGAGSLCGRAMGAKWVTTIGYERKYNPSLQIKEKDEFVHALTNDMPPAPDHFSRSSEINRLGPTSLEQLPVLKEISIAKIQEYTKDQNYLLLDTRNYLAFGSLHIPGSLHLDLNGNFPTFAGWVIPPERNIVLIADSHETAISAAVWARRVGVDQIVGYLDGGITAWTLAGLETSSVEQISVERLHDRIIGKSKFVLLDVRSPSEYADSHIKGAVNVPVADLRTRYKEFRQDVATIIICSSGNRSSLGTSILKQNGFENVFNVAGGMTGYSAAGYIKECEVCENPHGARYYSH